MPSELPNDHRWRAFALLAVTYFMTIVDFTIVNVSLPTIQRDLHLSATGLQWVVMAFGMTLIGAGILWTTRAPVHGHLLKDLAGPFLLAGAGTAFAFIPISIAALAGVGQHQAGLASGLLNTSQQLGGAVGVAIASSIAAGHTSALLRAGHALPEALTGGYQRALWALGTIALLALPAIFALLRRETPSEAPVGAPAGSEPQPVLAANR